jgi:outer membrane protein assembly factor BamE (lipoprotein component of BamABCDE complex)
MLLVLHSCARLSRIVRRRNSSIEMTPTEFPITQELWQVACARGVKREQLRRVFGSPHFIETTWATYGGEEDW